MLEKTAIERVQAEPATAQVVVVFHHGHVQRLPGVDFVQARREHNRYLDWASIGGTRNTRDDWPDGVALDLISETNAVRMVVPYASIAALVFIPGA